MTHAPDMLRGQFFTFNGFPFTITDEEVMSSHYRGESPGKEAARSVSYSKLTAFELYYMKHIVTAGRCGDIEYLLRQGVKPKNIIACDKLVGYRAMASKYGITLPPTGISDDIVKTVDWAMDEPGRIGSVNVDLCLTLHKGCPILNQVKEALRGNRPHLFFTFLCGRDQGLGKPKWEPSPGQKRKHYFYVTTDTAVNRVEFFPYQSFNATSMGSPMCAAIM
jgi:hypothetical protein